MEIEKLSTLIPMHELEQEAQQQIYYNLNLWFLEKLAIMPDCHPGYLLPIGGVALLNNVISPNYVGYDQGCGMCCVITQINYKEILKDEKRNKKIFNQIYREIPVGFNSREDNYFNHPEFKSASGNKELNQKVNNKLISQLGTLGGGNHFIEIGKDKKDRLGITIHSGSRNPGHSVADFYMKKAKVIDKDLPDGFLHLNSEWGQMFLQDLNFTLEYALANRKSMMSGVFNILGFNKKEQRELLSLMINENHNHAVVQNNNKVLHRKGATESAKGQFGIIPGNMRDGVYVVVGLGNEKYLCSSSHGSGRKGSRKWAKASISLDRFKQSMTGIIAKVDNGTIDESPDAYKNISSVIKAQEGIVIDVINHITPIINIKG